MPNNTASLLSIYVIAHEGAALFITAMRLLGTLTVIALIYLCLAGISTYRMGQRCAVLLDAFVQSHIEPIPAELDLPYITEVLSSIDVSLNAMPMPEIVVERLGATSIVSTHKVEVEHARDLLQFTVAEMEQYLGTELVTTMKNKTKPYLFKAIVMDWDVQHLGEQH